MNVTPLRYDAALPVVATPADRAQSVVELMPAFVELASRIANTEFVPTALRRRPEAVLAALMSGAERGLGPMESLRSVHVIEGRPTLSAEAMRALVLAAGHDIDIVESTPTRATVVGRRAGSDSFSPPFTWTMDRARRARLASKDTWQRYPEAMLLARASTDLCRAVFPDVIAGLASTEEIVDELVAAEPSKSRRAPARRPPAVPAPAPDPVPAAVAPMVAADEHGGIPWDEEPSWGAPLPEPEPHDATLGKRIHAQLADATPGTPSETRDRWRHALVAVTTRDRPTGPVASSNDLTLEEQLKLSDILTRIASGRATIVDGPDGVVELRTSNGWRYAVTLDPVEVFVQRGDQSPGAEAGTSDSPSATAPDEP